MTLRIVPTPLAPLADFPSPREGRLDATLTDAILPSPARDAAVTRLRRPDAVAVTTGQQPGLFTGPLYTIYKALSAAAVARVLERQWQRPVVAVFWVAGDDHDYVEASQANWIASSGAVHRAALPPRPAEAPLTPLYREPLGDEIDVIVEQLAADLGAAEFRDWTIEWLRRHYHSGATLAGSFAGALAEVLAPAGVVCLDSTPPAVKRAAAPLIVRALGLAHQLDRDLEQRAEELRTIGRAPDVSVGENATLVMLDGLLGRDRLLIENGGFVTRRGGEPHTLETLQRIAAEAPERLSPNVLLRPVVESALLPTVAYLAGPGELSYLPLTQPVYERLRVPRQAVLPRWSGILVEPRVDRVLQKFGIELAELLEAPGALESRLVRSQLPDETVRALRALRDSLTAGYDALARSAAEIDPTLTRAIQGTKNQALAGLRDSEKKLVQHLKRRQELELGQISKARVAVLPENQPQERVLTIAPFLARYGPALIGELAEAVETWYAAALEGALDPS
ncbi:MAG TPA: bacillithiol biosynthesis cysteine-adding enzyme BshC [Gemmatimonadales bacterium]|nr:bacillithiol biosynthesis cysteine-adding enzyme BshC [Gemmatimonadales bacterium]